jgi:hypothetical protein
MPKTWIYYLAVILPLIAHLLVMDTRFFLEWLWYNGHADYYDVLNVWSVNPRLVEMFGSWALPFFIGTILCYWIGGDEEDISGQFLLLPLAYVPFLILGNTLINAHFEPSTLYVYPLIVIPVGYLYLFPWIVFIAVFDRLRLVVD